MKRQSLVLLAVAFVAAGAAGCFKDPVSSLRNGPAVLSSNVSALFLKTGDSATVIAYLKDNAGNELAVTGVTWTTANAAIAVVDTLPSSGTGAQPIPGNAYAKAYVRAVDSISGGWTNVIVTSRGIADTIRVVVLPAKFNKSLVARTGPSLTDTIFVPASLLPPAPPDTLAYTAADTLVLNGTSLLTFDTSKVTVTVSTLAGASKGFIVSKTPSQLKVVFENGTAGKAMIQHLLLTPGNSKVGTVTVDTLITDSVAVAPWRVGQAASGITASVTSNVLTVTLPAGMSFTGSSSATFNGAPVAVIAQSANTLSFFSTVAATTGKLVVYNVQMTGGTGVPSVTFDSLMSNVGTFTLSPAFLPNGNVTMSPNNGKLGDTIIVTAPAGMTFSTSGAVSRALVGNQAINTSDTAWNVSLTANTMKLFAKRGGSGTVTVTNLVLPVTGAVPFNLTTPGTTAIDSVNSDLPVSQTQGGALALNIPANDTAIVYGTALPGALNGGFAQSYWTFTTSATHTIKGTVSWFGSGSPYSTGTNTTAYTEDLDMLICNASTACDESAADLSNFAAATAVQPQAFSVAALPAAQYWINVAGFNVKYTIIYQLAVILQ